MNLNETNKNEMQEHQAVSPQKGAVAPKSSFKKQKIAAIVLAAVVVLLVATLILVHYGISVYPLEDRWTVNGETFTETYYIRKKDGAYALYNKDGKLMEINALESQNKQAATDTPYVIYIAETSGNQYLIDTSTGAAEPYASVDYGGGEELGFNNRVLMYPMISEKDVYSIKVDNQYGGYEFYRGSDGEFVLKGFEESTAAHSADALATLCSACGYTITMQRLDMNGDVARLPSGEVDYEAYGLGDSAAVFTITKANIQNNTYSASDVSYTVKVGNRTHPGTGYYMQLEGRDTIYVGDASVESTVLSAVEALMSPVLIHEMNTSNYVLVKNFMFGRVDGNLSDLGADETIQDMYPPIVAFSFSSLDDRLSTIETVSPYVYPPDFTTMDGYALNSNNVSGMLLQLFQLNASSCLRLGLNAETLAEFGLDKNVYYLTFDSPATDSNGNTYYLPNTLFISQKTERGTYYIASTVCDMIVEVDQSALGFLEWKPSDWYMQYFFQYNIAHVSSLNIQIGDQNYAFSLENLYSYAFYEDSTGTMKRINLKNGASLKMSNGVIYYSDSTVQNKPVTLFDLQKGDFYIRLDAKGTTASPIYGPYYKYLITQDRNGDMEMKLVELLEDGTEKSYTYDLGNKNDPRYSYRMVYRSESGEEFDVAGSYKNGSSDNRIAAYYQMAYWVEDSDGNWTRRQTPNLATNLMLRDAAGKIYQIPVASTNLIVSCEQYTEGKNTPNALDYTTTYTYKTDTGLIETDVITGADNFRKLFGKFTVFSLEDVIDRDTFQKDYGTTPEEYVKANAPYATFTYTVRDMADNMNLISYLEDNDGTSKKPIADEKLWHNANEKEK